MSKLYALSIVLLLLVGCGADPQPIQQSRSNAVLVTRQIVRNEFVVESDCNLLISEMTADEVIFTTDSDCPITIISK